MADVLVQVSDEIDAALIVATHDQAIGARMRAVWPMHDGRLHPATTRPLGEGTRSSAGTSADSLDGQEEDLRVGGVDSSACPAPSSPGC